MTIKQQNETMLSLMRNRAGGVNSYFAMCAMHIKEPAERVKDLKHMGYYIKTVPNDDRTVQYLLLDKKPARIKPTPVQRYWLMNDATNIAREVSKEEYELSKRPVQMGLL